MDAKRFMLEVCTELPSEKEKKRFVEFDFLFVTIYSIKLEILVIFHVLKKIIV